MSHTQVAAETSEARQSNRSAERLARMVSALFCPPVVAIVAALMLTLGCHAPASDANWVGLGVFLVSGVIVPVGYVLFLRRRGSISGIFIAEGRKRIRPLLVASGSCLAGAALLNTVVQVSPLSVLLVWYGLFAVAAAVLANGHHVSLHAAGAWGPVFGLVYCCGSQGWALLPPAILVAWARRALGAHSPRQILIGVLVGSVSAWATFSVADIGGLLH